MEVVFSVLFSFFILLFNSLLLLVSFYSGEVINIVQAYNLTKKF